MRTLDRRLSVAPMMDWTDRHCRYFLRLIAPRALLYTEMIPTGAILSGDPDRLLRFDQAERPLALQLGGAEPGQLARCAEAGAVRGYDEINLNVGCPSDRVQNARIGACLMAEPELVAACVRAMRAAAPVPVTVKSRIGIDRQDSYEFLRRFVAAVAGAGCRTVILHARNAWLSGLSPKKNREVPPLRYELVHRVKAEFPELEVIVNGGIHTLEQARAQLAAVDGVMIGRAAYQNPYVLAEWERVLFKFAEPSPSRIEIVERLLAYVERECAAGTPLHAITRHILGLFNGLPGARAWRRHLSEAAHRPGAGPEVILDAMSAVRMAATRRDEASPAVAA
ncbi:MAG TPA: tRNA dihydrouridine(20/20a) synthase DusA [Geminicoccaceae bacterium]|nr:tRNA dihydrouridine(20/20a) synthase DusA [Geminicoccaceae bacterium]